MDQSVNISTSCLHYCPRRYFRHISAFCALLLLLYQPRSLNAQADVRAELDTSRIMIGDQVGLTLTIACEPGVQIQDIDWSVLEKKDTLEILRSGQLDTIPGSENRLLEQRVRLQAFEAGSFQVSALPVRYRYQGRDEIVRTNPLSLEVTTFPVESDTAALAPIKTIIEEPLKLQDVLPYLLLLGALVLIGLLLAWLLRRKKQAEAPPAPEVQRPAHEIAREKLSALRAGRSWEAEDLKPFYSELTYIVREYLENRYHIPALESTTEETMAQLRQTGLDEEWREQLRELLRTADLVKFAKSIPPLSKHEPALKRAEIFVEETREAPEEAGDEQEEENTTLTQEKNKEQA